MSKAADKGTEKRNMLQFLITPADGVTDARYLEARVSLWAYCKLMNPKFYRDDRPHLRTLADCLQRLYEGKLLRKDGTPYRKIIINIPPRHGKSYILSMFTQWAFGKSSENRVITVSYNETLAIRFAKGVRDAIDQEKADPRITIFNDIFPRTKIKYGDASAQLWSLDGQFFSYLATGFGGTITGVGCNVLIIDDPVKNSMEAANDNALETQWSWYTDTILSRVEEDGIQIVNMTRWAEGDLAGRLIAANEADGEDEWYVLAMPACLDEDTKQMLCPALMSWKRYEAVKRRTSPEILSANYNQQILTMAGRMYGEFETYTELPMLGGRLDFETIINYTDTADTGADFLCSLTAGVRGGRGYLLDVIYTDAPMEITEPKTADMLVRNSVALCKIESNNGGRGFARNVDNIIRHRYRIRSISIMPFTQHENKAARIITHSASVMRNMVMPADWEKRWSEFAKAICGHRRVGTNRHDDAADALTGLDEMIEVGISTRTSYKSGKGAI